MDTMLANPGDGPRTPLSVLYGFLFRKNYTIWNFLEANQARFGDVVRLPIPFHAPVYQVSDPDLIGKILIGTERSNVKSIFFERMKKVAGNGLILSGGEIWRVNRKLATPAFHPRMLDRMKAIIESEVDGMIEDWNQKVEENPIVNISEEMSKLLLNVIVKILFTSDFKNRSQAINEAMAAFQEYSAWIYYNPFDLPLWLPLPIHRKLKKVVKVFDEITYELINEHRAHPENYQDLLSAYLSAKDEDSGESMSDQQLRDEVLTLILAGHESTAASVAMGLFALATEPEVSEAIRADQDMAYTSLVQQEILRLYPAIWAISREMTEDLAFKGRTYPKGSIFLVSQHLMHRHPKHWDNPLSFDPARFLPENAEGRHPFAYFPFGGGKRNCIGMGLARMEINIAISRFLRAFHFEVSAEHKHLLKPQFTTTPLPFIALKVSKREPGVVREAQFP